MQVVCVCGGLQVVFDKNQCKNLFNEHVNCY